VLSDASEVEMIRGGQVPQLHFARAADYPRLAWCCEQLTDGGWQCRAGADVEFLPGCLVEGCWDGPFAQPDLARTTNLFGSGVAAFEEAVWFCPPAHTCDALYVASREGRRWVANSLFVALRESRVELEVHHNYTKRLFTLAYGIDAADQVIYSNGGTKIERILYDNFTIVQDKIIRRRKPNIDVPLRNFDEYKNYLLGVISRCAANATDDRRLHRYALLCTVSSGYDSTTAAALGKQAGADTAITVRSGRRGIDDTGRPAAEAIGLVCIERDRLDPAQQTSRSEIEFLMSGAGGADYPISAFSDVLVGRLCLTGYLGDKMWDLHGHPNTTLERGDNVGASLAEFRLRLGYLHLPVPFIAATHHPDVDRISHLPEMGPFSVGGDYDRPIARRIIEEAGVPRGVFARSKKGMALIFSWGPMFLSPPVREGFHRFLREQGLLVPVYGRHAAFHLCHLGFRSTRKLMERFKLQRWLGGAVDRLHRSFRAYENSPFSNLLFIWAMREALSGRYKPGEETGQAGEPVRAVAPPAADEPAHSMSG